LVGNYEDLLELLADERKSIKMYLKEMDEMM
jgi:hypothetical protein